MIVIKHTAIQAADLRPNFIFAAGLALTHNTRRLVYETLRIDGMRLHVKQALRNWRTIPAAQTYKLSSSRGVELV
jgi:hypothetical protein